MQVSVESPSKIERRITVVVPVEKLDAAYDKRIVKLSKTAKVNGFRTGKIPLEVIKNHFGDSARQEALSEVIQSSLYTAIDQEKLNPVGVPMVEPKKVLVGQPLEFVATFEVLPEIEKVHFQADKIEKEISTIQEEDITRVVEHLRGQHTTWKKVTRPAKEKDQVLIDFSGTIDGKAFTGGQAHDYPIIIGSKMMIPGFEEGLIGLNINDEKSIPVKFPEDYFAKEVAGKNAEFAVTVIGISEPQVPVLDENFIKKLGVKSGSLDDLRAEINKNLQRELQRLIKTKLKTAVFNKLIEQNSVEVPKALVEKEAKRIHDELHPHHKDDEHHSHSEAEMASFTEAAKRNVTLGLLVGELIKQFKITADQEKINEHLQTLSAAYENPAQVVEWYKRNKRSMAEIEMLILEEHVMEKLLEGVTVTEKMLSYSDFVNQSAA